MRHERLLITRGAIDALQARLGAGAKEEAS